MSAKNKARKSTGPRASLNLPSPQSNSTNRIVRTRGSAQVKNSTAQGDSSDSETVRTRGFAQVNNSTAQGDSSDSETVRTRGFAQVNNSTAQGDSSDSEIRLLNCSQQKSDVSKAVQRNATQLLNLFAKSENYLKLMDSLKNLTVRTGGSAQVNNSTAHGDSSDSEIKLLNCSERKSDVSKAIQQNTTEAPNILSKHEKYLEAKERLLNKVSLVYKEIEDLERRLREIVDNDIIQRQRAEYDTRENFHKMHIKEMREKDVIIKEL